MTLKQHPLSAKFPLMSDEALKSLAADIKKRGLQHSIWLYKGMVLDGWNRVLACKMAGVNPRTDTYLGSDPQGFVISENLERRLDLNPSQKAMIAVQVWEWLPEGKPGLTPSRDGVRSNPFSRSTEEMAESAGVGSATIERAKKVEVNGSKELKEAVKSGEITVTEAAAVTSLPKAKQAKAARKPKPKKEAKPKPEPKEDFGDTMVDALEQAQSTISSQQEVIDSLNKSDLAAEVLKWKDKFARMEGRVRQLMTTEAEARKQATYSTGLLTKIRAALKVEKNSEILPALAAK